MKLMQPLAMSITCHASTAELFPPLTFFLRESAMCGCFVLLFSTTMAREASAVLLDAGKDAGPPQVIGESPGGC